MTEIARCPECGEVVSPTVPWTVGIATTTDDQGEETQHIVGIFHPHCWAVFEAERHDPEQLGSP
jgi:hypothetical protein